MQADLEPRFPLPQRGDRVQVAVTETSLKPPPPVLLASPRPDPAARPGLTWCRVVRVDDGPYDLFPVTVRLPSGRLGAYQQTEICGWRPAWWRRLVDWARGV